MPAIYGASTTCWRWYNWWRRYLAPTGPHPSPELGLALALSSSSQDIGTKHCRLARFLQRDSFLANRSAEAMQCAAE